MEGFTCPGCGRGEIRRTSLGGRKMRFRQIPDLELPPTVEGPVCSECGELWMDEPSTKAVAAALETAWSEAVLKKAQSAIEVLRKTTPQRELESLLGLSPGWLSKIKGGRETSASTAAALLLLANDPSRVEELKASWSHEAREADEIAPVISLDSVRIRARTGRAPAALFSPQAEVTVSTQGNALPISEAWQGELVA